MEYSVFIQYDEVDNIFVASIPELPGCMAHGETKEKALAEIETARKLWIESARADGKEVPSPHLYGTAV